LWKASVNLQIFTITTARETTLRCKSGETVYIYGSGGNCATCFFISSGTPTQLSSRFSCSSWGNKNASIFSGAADCQSTLPERSTYPKRSSFVQNSDRSRESRKSDATAKSSLKAKLPDLSMNPDSLPLVTAASPV